MARHERLHYLKKITALSKRDIAVIQDPLSAFNFDDANRMIENAIGMLIVELIIDTQDSMGANVINTMCETIAPKVEELTGGSVILRILSNYATRRLVRCKAIFAKNELGGEHIVERILYAYAFAYSDI